MFLFTGKYKYMETKDNKVYYTITLILKNSILLLYQNIYIFFFLHVVIIYIYFLKIVSLIYLHVLSNKCERKHR